MKYIAVIVFFISFTSCNEIDKTKKEPKIEQEYKDGLKYDAIFKHVITGDFDGDGKEDELKETLISSINNKSIDAFPQLEYDSLVTFIYNQKPVLSLQTANKNIPDLIITEKVSFGIMWIKNEGDLNNDGSDEISIVIDWADWSQVNSCIVYSMKASKWTEYAKFDIREYQISRDPDFNGFIIETKKGVYEVSTFDSESNEILKPLNEIMVNISNRKS